MAANGAMWVVLFAVLISTIDSGVLKPIPEERDESGFFTVADFGKLITDACGKLDDIKAKLDDPLVAGAAGPIMDQALPFPNLAILDIFGILDFITKYFGMLQDWLNEMMSGKKPAPPTPPELTYGDYADESAPVAETKSQGSLLMTPKDLINGVAYACKALSLVGNILQNPVTGALSLPIPDPNYPKKASVEGFFSNPLGLGSVFTGLVDFVISPIVENTIMPLINLIKNAIISGGHPPTTIIPPTTTAGSSWFFG